MVRCIESSVVLRERRDRVPPSKEQATKQPVPISVAEYVRLSTAGNLPTVDEKGFLKPMYREELPGDAVSIAHNVLNQAVSDLIEAEKDALDKLAEAGWEIDYIERDGTERVIPYKPLGSEIETEDLTTNLNDEFGV